MLLLDHLLQLISYRGSLPAAQWGDSCEECVGVAAFLSLFAAFRLILPLKLKFALVICSYKLLPALERL